ncbi:class I SAM-dependent methyltransferase [Candidatus Micrarchaeota archaeon]|nr:class I SAM-dependent methyltransferase [Candidatus Micrarchaeota archaeon]MBU1165997.1 class I SAM-dependent methyltransferase [Candidatus Micrarchaeota archaeon]MBU1886783.1 class I SAM-dependent methyltransferase [Candidatus Micrarchaeota archaeon]
MGDWESIFKKDGKVFLTAQEDMEKIIKLLKKEKVRKILDLGCGSGRHTVLFAKQGFDVYATDISKTGLKMTRKWLKEKNLCAKLKEHSCYEKFPFKDKRFDAIISTQVIHHNFHEKVKFCISEIERVLKPGGLIFITVAANKRKQGATAFMMSEPRTYTPLDGKEKGVPHFIYTKTLMKKDFKNFKILSICRDNGNHWCLLGRLKET